MTDPNQVAQETAASLEEVQRNLASLNTTLGAFITVMVRSNKNLDINDDAVKQLTNNMQQLSKAEKILLAEQERRDAQMQGVKNAAGMAGAALIEYGKNMVDGKGKLSDYSNAVRKAGDAAVELGKNFGIAGLAIGWLVKLWTEHRAATMDQASAMIEARNQFYKLGGAGSLTSKQLLDLGHNALLTSANLDRMVKPLQSLRTNILTFGNDAGTAGTKFAQVLGEVGNEELKRMERLGYTQDEVYQGIADYATALSQQGIALKNQNLTMKQIKDNGIAYQKNLLDLSALTGENVDDLKKKQQDEALNRQVLIQDMQDQIKIQDLRKQAASGDLEAAKEADRLQETMNNRAAALNKVAGLVPPAILEGLKQIVTTGNAAGKGVILANNNLLAAAQRFKESYEKGVDPVKAAAQFATEYRQATQQTVRGLGEAAKNSAELAEALGLDDLQNLKQTSLTLFTDYVDELNKITKKRITAEQEMYDMTVDTQANLASAARSTSVFADKTLENTSAYVNQNEPAIGGGKSAPPAQLTPETAGPGMTEMQARKAGWSRQQWQSYRDRQSDVAAGKPATAAPAAPTTTQGGASRSMAPPVTNTPPAGTTTKTPAPPPAATAPTVQTKRPTGNQMLDRYPDDRSAIASMLMSQIPAKELQDPKKKQNELAYAENKADRIYWDKQKLWKDVTTVQDLKDQGLKIKDDSVQMKDAYLSQAIVRAALQIQNIPGFKYFTSFNDKTHSTLDYESKHKTGDALDFTLVNKPTKEQGEALVAQLTKMGFSYAKDEYNDPSKAASAGHIHAQLATGGLASGPKSGYPVTLHGTEMVVPLDPKSILAELGKKTTAQAENEARTINAKSSVMSEEGTKFLGQIVGVNKAMLEMMADKLDTVIDKLNDSNDHQANIKRSLSA